MKLTIEQNKERLKRFSHIRPAPIWQSIRCEVKCPGTRRECSRERNHKGLHAAHNLFGKVLAVWDEGGKTPVQVRRRPAATVQKTPVAVKEGKDRSLAIKILAVALKKISSIEEAFLLLLALAMAGFAIDWALRILGFY